MHEPEQDPRYIPPINEFVPDAVSEAEVEADLEYHEEILGMFAHKGWEHVGGILTDVRANHVKRLTKFSGADSMEVIYGLRSGLAIIDEILGVEESSKGAVERDKALLYQLREAKQG